MAKRLHSDRVLLITTFLILFFGLVMVFSASAVISSEEFGHPYYFLGRQLAWAVVGVLALVLLMRIDYRTYRHETFVFVALSASLLLLIAVLFAAPSRSTHRWFRWGPLSLQPSELAKPIIVVFLAWFLEDRLKKTESVNDRRTLLSVTLVVGAAVGLILGGRDLGTALMVTLIGLAMLIVAGLNVRWLMWAPVIAAPAFYFFVYREPYRMARVRVWFDPFRDPTGQGFHMVQSLIAVGTGGLFGVGLMHGKQKLFYLFAPHTDFIFAVVAEELGLLGAGLLVLAFVVFFWRGMIAARRAPDLFGRLLAVGLTVMIVFQAFINFSVVLGLLPAKGIPLPFVSYGGSSLVFNLLAVGILLNVTRHAN